MSVKIAEAHADITAKQSAGFNNALSGVRQALAGIAKAAAVAGAALGGAAFARGVVAFEEQEQAAGRLRGALALSGQEVAANSAAFAELAKNISAATDFTKAQTSAAIAAATDAGAPAAEMGKLITKSAGLAQATKRDLTEVTAAVTEYYKGNVDALDSLIPSLNTAANATEKKLRADKALVDAGRQAAQETGGVARQLKNAREKFDEVAASLGQQVAPAIIAAVDALSLLPAGFAVAQAAAVVAAEKIYQAFIVIADAVKVAIGAIIEATKVMNPWLNNLDKQLKAAGVDAFGAFDVGKATEQLKTNWKQLFGGGAASDALSKAAEEFGKKWDEVFNGKKKNPLVDLADQGIPALNRLKQAASGFFNPEDLFTNRVLEKAEKGGQAGFLGAADVRAAAVAGPAAETKVVGINELTRLQQAQLEQQKLLNQRLGRAMGYGT